METWVVILLLPIPVLFDVFSDPAQGLFVSKQAARNMDCVRMSQQRAHELYPDKIPEVPARRMPQMESSAMVCTPRILQAGDRPPREELVLSHLSRTASELAEAAIAAAPADVRWHVDSFYPEPVTASKLSIAVRTDLAERGRKVSDRVPLLAAGDLLVLRDLGPRDAYPLACARYFQEGSLGPNDAFLGVILLDPRESELHAGVCANGGWRWLR